uniref:NB-ARC domain-containing protein n=1 Tax=Fagus sylvatica TaxID=28930 RepID=A0A2N9FCX9_FAGSY
MADLLMGEAIQVLLESLASEEVIDFLRIHEVEDGLLEKFKTMLQSVTLVLNDAEEKQDKSREVKAWLDELQDVVYLIQDLIDEISTEASQHKLDAESQSEKSPAGGILFLGKWAENLKKGIERKIRQILDRLQSLAKRNDGLGLKKGIQNEMKQSPSMPISSFADDSEVFGRDSDKEAIFKLLLSSEASGEDLSVIPIVGEVGIGKTTLARLVYNDDKVSEYFEMKAWAHVSDHFDMFMVIKAIFESFTMQSCDLKELNMIQVRLQESLRGKKFLLVLDDVWAETYYHDWEFLLSPFKGAAKGSRVIVTTRIQSVASMVGTDSAYHMNELLNEDRWSLLAKFSFGDQYPSSYPKLEVLGREIVELCGGFPLALRTLGAFLGLKLQVEEWEAVRKHLIPFPNEKRKKEKLVLLWMAEGLLQLLGGNRRMEDVGDEYFRELLLRLEYDDTSGITAWTRYLSLFRCKYDCPMIFEAIDKAKFIKNLFATGLPKNMLKFINLRHLDISGTDLNEMPKEMSRLESLQTLSNFVVSKMIDSAIKELGGILHLHGTLRISKLQNVVSTKDAAEAGLVEKTQLDELVLEWSDNTVNSENDRDVLEQLVPHTNLKKLSISFYCSTRFPPWLGDFSFSNMVFLCLSKCKNCLDLPPLGQLPSLKVLIIEWMDSVKRVGPEFCGMDNPFQSLETLTFEGMLEWEEWVSFDDEGGEFPRLRELSIRRCPKLKGNLPKQFPSIVKVEISESQELVTTLLTEASLHKRLLHYYDEVLFISDGKAVSFSQQMTLFTSEGAIESSLLMTQGGLQDLSSFESIKVSEISQLMKLPVRLDSLKIEGCDSLELIPEQNCKELEFLPLAEKTDQYACLQHLCIGSSCDSLKSLPLDFFPKLRNLSIWDCANLESLSMTEGIQKNLMSLEALEIRDCPKLVSLSKGGLPTTNLTSIWLSNCKSFKEPPHQLHNLNSLQSMFLNNCQELVSLSQGGLPSKLSLLSITFWNKLMVGKEWGLHGLECLTRLEIEGVCKNVVSFLEEKLLHSNLKSLRVSGLLNLKYLNYKGLQHLPALKTLEISCCNKLQSLPLEGLPSSLSFLCIKECALLKPKLQNNWSKIAQIARIEIDEEVIP